MDVEERFARLVDDLVGEPGVEPPGSGRKRGFGSSALTVDGSIFAMLVNGGLVVKLPAARVAEIIGSGAGSPFSSGSGRPMREWVAAAPDADWGSLAREALAFVGGR